MSTEVCPVCGLPLDLCVCKEISKEAQRIKVRVEKRKWGREVTIIEGIDSSEIDIHDLTTRLKSKLACGGTAKNNRIELQGDHRYRVKDLLVSLGFPPENIDVE